jgi:hypothetical protein
MAVHLSYLKHYLKKRLLKIQLVLSACIQLCFLYTKRNRGKIGAKEISYEEDNNGIYGTVYALWMC